jgi:protein-tyrosine phosphatase
MEHSNEIIPYLYLGDAGFVYEPKSYSLIINCCPEVDINYPEPSNVLYLRFHDDPRDNPKFLSQLETHKVLEKIHEQVLALNPVIVHCAMGIQRSASVIACYLLKYGIINGVQDTLDFIRSKRDVAFSTGYNFLPAIKKYQKSLDSLPKTLHRSTLQPSGISPATEKSQ